MTEPLAPEQDLADLAVAAQRLLRLEETPTDTGNSHRFARLVGDKVRYVPAEDTWLVWDGSRLKRDETGTVMDMTRLVCNDVTQHVNRVEDDDRARWREWARATESVTRRSAILALARTLPELIIPAEGLDAQPHLLNTPSGTLDLNTLTLREARIADHITRCTREPYDETIESSTLLAEYVSTFMPEPTHWRYLMKMLGSILYGGNDYRMWYVIIGPTTSGKSQLVEAIAQALGDYAVPVNTSVFRANQDDKPRPDLLRALTARFVYAEEGSQAWALHGDHIKRMTGGDPLTARGMRSNIMVERVPSFTPLIVCNSMPRVKDADPGIRRRLRAARFDHSVAGRELAGKRRAFLDDPATSQALLTLLARGCREAYIEGMSNIPKAWVDATMEAFDELDHVADFVNWLGDSEQLVEVDQLSPLNVLKRCWKAHDLHITYGMWLGMHGSYEEKRQALSLKELNRALRGRGWVSELSEGTRWSGKIRPVKEYVRS